MKIYTQASFEDAIEKVSRIVKKMLNDTTLLEWEVTSEVELYDAKIVCKSPDDWRWQFQIDVFELSKVPLDLLLDQSIENVLQSFIRRHKHPISEVYKDIRAVQEISKR